MGYPRYALAAAATLAATPTPAAVAVATPAIPVATATVHRRYCCRHRSRCRGRGHRRLATTTTHHCHCRGQGRFVGVAKLSPFVATVMLSCSWWSRSQLSPHSYRHPHRCRHPPLLPSPLLVASSMYSWFGVVVMAVAAQPLSLLGSQLSLPSCHRRIHPTTTLIALVAAWGLAWIAPPDDGGSGLESTFDSGAGSGIGNGGGDDGVVRWGGGIGGQWSAMVVECEATAAVGRPGIDISMH
ncbi:hypothetical protein EDB84DRAFT_1444416 [Lactarius hengduanensis]|nr:hypothetical protein EDB84DRAFT_1444416 [Lactarius hengduanensis]